MSKSDKMFSFKPSFRNLLNFNIIWFAFMAFLMMILFQFSPTIAKNNVLLFYSGISFNAEFTTTGWTIVTIALFFFFISLILGYMRKMPAYIFGALSMVLIVMLFYAGNYILFANVMT